MRSFTATIGVAACVTVGVVVWGAQAHAQQMEPGYLNSDRPLQTWPQAFASENQPIVITVSGDATYESNAVRASPAFAASRGLQVSDWYFTPEGTIDVTRSNGRFAGFLHGVVGYDFYSSDTVLDHQWVDAKGGAQAAFGRCSATLSGSYDRQAANVQQVPIEITDNVLNVEGATISASCPRPIGFSPVLSYDHEWGDYSSDLLKFSDYRVSDLTGGISYTNPVLGTVSLYGDYQRTAYPYRPTLGTGSIADGFKTYSGGVRVEHNLGARLGGSVYLAYTSLDPFVSGVPGFSGVTFGGQLAYRLTPKINLTATFDRAASPSILYNSNFVLRYNVTGNVDYKLSRRLSVAAGMQWTKRDYEGAATGASGTVFADDYKEFFASVRVNLGRRIQVALTGRRQERDASDPVFAYGSNGVILSVRAQY